jgi:hypothetical protein
VTVLLVPRGLSTEVSILVLPGLALIQTRSMLVTTFTCESEESTDDETPDPELLELHDFSSWHAPEGPPSGTRFIFLSKTNLVPETTNE